MKISLIKPPQIGNQVRGIGFYTTRLFDSLKKRDLDIKLESYSLFSSSDLLHFPYFDLFTTSFPPLRLKKTIVTLHDIIPLKFPDHFPLGKKAKVLLPLELALLRHVSAILTDSQASKRDLLTLLKLPPEKIFVTYLAPDPIFVPLKNKSRLLQVKKLYDLPDKFVLYVGGANWNKNVISLVRACKKTGLNLILVGREFSSVPANLSNVELQPLKEVLAEFSGRKIGYVPTEDLVAIYNLAAVYVQPSIYEGFGLPLLEAMACGTPVVSGRGGSLSEIGGPAPLYANVEDIDDLSAKINLALKGLDKNKLLAQATQFSWEKTAQETLKVYEKVLSGS